MNAKKDLENLPIPEAPELTVISEDEKTFKGVIRWIISKSEIEKCLERMGKTIKSDFFSIGSPSYCSFYFLFCPVPKSKLEEWTSTEKSSKIFPGSYAELSIIFKGKFPGGAWVSGKISFDGLSVTKSFNNDKLCNEKIEFDSLLLNSDLKEFLKRKEHDFTVNCLIKIKVRSLKCVFDKQSVLFAESRDYDSCKESFKRESFSDVSIRVEGREIKTHKVLLAQIPYFQDLFDEDESKHHFELTNIKHSTLEHILDFLYTGDIPRLHFKLACELYIVASDLKVFDLKNLCSSYLGANLSEINVFIVVKLSHEYEDVLLKKECIKFIKNSDVNVLAEKSLVL